MRLRSAVSPRRTSRAWRLRYLRTIELLLFLRRRCVAGLSGGPGHDGPRAGERVSALQGHAPAPVNDDLPGCHIGPDDAGDLQGTGSSQRLEEGVRTPAIAELDAADVGLRRHVRVGPIGGKDQCGRI